jgi:hypothetical protein
MLISSNTVSISSFKWTFFVLFALSLKTTPLCAQDGFVVVADSDGYANLRKEPKIGNNVLMRLDNGELLYAAGLQGDWCQVCGEKNGQIISGYIFKDRLKEITAFESIRPRDESDHQMVFHRGSIAIEINTARFDPKEAQIKYDPKNPGRVLEINGSKPLGNSERTPGSRISSIKVRIGAKYLEIPPSTFNNLYDHWSEFTLVYYNPATDALYIYITGEWDPIDYAACWVVQKGMYKQRLVYTL